MTTLLAICLAGGCEQSNSPSTNTPGPAILLGAAPPGVTVIVYRPIDYSWPLGRMAVPAGTDSFRISGLPADTVDVINMGGGYLASKKCNYVLQEGDNAFKRGLSDVEYLDSRGWARWQWDELFLKFKDVSIDSAQGSEILLPHGCEVVSVAHHWFEVDIPDTRTVPEMVQVFVLDPRVLLAVPMYVVYAD